MSRVSLFLRAGAVSALLVTGGVAYANSDAMSDAQYCRTPSGYVRLSLGATCRAREIPIELPAGVAGSDGLDGRSAFQTWLALGNSGSEADFIASLQGAIGVTGLQGLAGDSAFETWLALGNVGDEADFLSSLKGDAGPRGEQGLQGIQGEMGAPGIQGETGKPGLDGQDGKDADTQVAAALDQRVADLERRLPTARELGGMLVYPGQVFVRDNTGSTDRLFISRNLSGAEMPGAVFGGIYFSRVDLSHSNLRGSRFNSVISYYSDFSYADVSGSDWNFEDASDNDFSHVLASGSTFTGHLASSRFVGANLSRVAFSGATLVGVDFSNADLTNSDFTYARAEGCRWSNGSVCIESATLNLQGANLSGAKLSGLRGAAIAGAPLALPAGWEIVDGVLIETQP